MSAKFIVAHPIRSPVANNFCLPFRLALPNIFQISVAMLHRTNASLAVWQYFLLLFCCSSQLHAIIYIIYYKSCRIRYTPVLIRLRSCSASIEDTIALFGGLVYRTRVCTTPIHTHKNQEAKLQKLIRFSKFSCNFAPE